MAQMNFKGHGGKLAFGKTKVFEVVISTYSLISVRSLVASAFGLDMCRGVVRAFHQHEVLIACCLLRPRDWGTWVHQTEGIQKGQNSLIFSSKSRPYYNY